MVMRTAVLALATVLAVAAAAAATDSLVPHADWSHTHSIELQSVPQALRQRDPEAVPSGGDSLFTQHFLPAGKAVCNDGSPIAIYTRKATAPSDKWLIHLMGGGACTEEDECAARSDFLKSSKPWPKVLPLEGLFGDTYFGEFNRVWVSYCTSDFYSGDASSEQVGFKTDFQFRGSHTVPALMSHLLSDDAPSDIPKFRDGKTLLFTGCSAGGIGSLVNKEYLLSVVPSSMAVRHVSDAGWFIDLPNTQHAFPLYMMHATSVWRALQAERVVAPSCMAAQPAHSKHLCLLGPFLFPYLPQPESTLVVESDTDSFNAKVMYRMDLEHLSEKDKEQLRQFGKATIDTLAPVKHAWAPNCLKHCWSHTDKSVSTTKVGGVAMADAVKEFLKDPSTPTRHIDACPSVMSNPTCPPPS